MQVAIGDVYDCLVEGTPEEYNIYTDNWGQGENLSFDTYRRVLCDFLDRAYCK